MKRILSALLLCCSLAASQAHAAAVTLATSLADTTNQPAYTSSAFTPAANDLLVVLVTTGTTPTSTPVISNSAGLTFTAAGTQASSAVVNGVFAASTRTHYVFVANALAAASSQTVTYTQAPSSSGAIVFVYRVSGMTRTGRDAVLQIAHEDDRNSAYYPTLTFGAALKTGNPTILLTGSSVNPAGITPPGGWTEPAGGDLGYASSTTGAETAYRNSGSTATSVSWASLFSTQHGSLGVELDTSAATPGFPATCAGGRTAVGITDTTNNTDPDNILYGQSPAVVANEDTICHNATSTNSKAVTVSAAGWVTLASGGSNLTDGFGYCIMDNGAACGTDGTFQITEAPVLSNVTGVQTGQTTATTDADTSQDEGVMYPVVITKTSHDTYGVPSHAQITAGVDANDANVAWGSEFTKSFLSTVSPGWTFSRASSQTYTKSDGTLGTVTSGNPAFTYSGGTAQGVLLEGARTNLFLRSTWAGSVDGSPGTAPTGWTYPTGTGNAAIATSTLGTDSIALSFSGTARRPFVSQTRTIAASTAHTLSVYIESITGTVTAENLLNVSSWPLGSTVPIYRFNGAVIDKTDTLTTGQSGRLESYVASSGIGGALESRIGLGCKANSTGTVQMSRPKLEAGAFASSYIPTTTDPVARVATDLTRSWTFDTNDFSGYLQAYPGFASTETSATNPVFSAYKDANNYLTITHPTTSGRMDLNLAIGGTTATAQVTGLTWAKGDKLDIRFRKNASGIKLWVEAGSTETTTGVAPNAFSTPPNTVRLGRDEGSNYGFWTVGNIQLWNSVDDTALGALN